MQPPSEADIVAATESIRVRKALHLAKLAALKTIRECIAADHSGDTLAEAISTYLSHLSTEHELDAEVLEAQAAYNERVLSSVRSQLILPTITRNRSN